MSDLIFVGLDGEMTGTEVSEGYGLCQIGVAFGVNPDQCFVSDIHPHYNPFIKSPFDHRLRFNPKSMEVCGFTEERVLQAPPQQEVDQRLYDFLIRNGASSEKKLLIPVGFQVVGFDMPYVRAFLPKSWSLFSRRGVDLNAVCFYLGGLVPYQGNYPKWNGWKRMAKANADAQLVKDNFPGQAHDAGYDAAQALLAYQWLRLILTDR